MCVIEVIFIFGFIVNGFFVIICLIEIFGFFFRIFLFVIILVSCIVWLIIGNWLWFVVFFILC